MTDNEIIKALDFCEGYNGVSFCTDCPLFDEDNCAHILSRESHNLINRQKAEIERLNAKIKTKDEINYYNMGQLKVTRDGIKTAKSEAIKEFAERLKENMRLEDDCDYDCENCFYDCNKYVLTIDNLVKEMTEEEE